MAESFKGGNALFLLTEEEKARIESIYGPQPLFDHALFSSCEINSVNFLTSAEEWFFEDDTLVSPYFTVQTVYKFRGNFTPIKFNLELGRLIEREPFLRSNYIRLGGLTLRVVVNRKSATSIFYRNISSQTAKEINSSINMFVDTDMRREFDLEKGELFRIAVFRTGEDEYAVVLTILAMIKKHFDMHGLLLSLAGADSTAARDKAGAASKGSGGLPITDAIREYWKNLLRDLPVMPKLPFYKESDGAFKQGAYHVSIPEEDISLLRGKSESNLQLLMCILQTAWGLFLQHFNDSYDTYCCVLMPKRNGTARTDGITMLPVRFTADGSTTIARAVNQQFRQLVSSWPYSCLMQDSIFEIMGSPKKIFGHFLCFDGFGEKQMAYSQVEARPFGALAARNLWDAQGIPLGVYFRPTNESVAVTFLYNKLSFENGGIQKIADRFLSVLHAMLSGWNYTLDEFRLALDAEFQGAKEIRYSAGPNELIKIPLLENVRVSSIRNLWRFFATETFFEGDYISLSEKENMLCFLLDGTAARLMENRSGWLNMLDFVKKGTWLNENVFLENKPSRIFLEIISESAVLVEIPKETMENLIDEEPFLMRRMFMHALSEMEKYRRFWINN